MTALVGRLGLTSDPLLVDYPTLSAVPTCINAGHRRAKRGELWGQNRHHVRSNLASIPRRDPAAPASLGERSQAPQLGRGGRRQSQIIK